MGYRKISHYLNSKKLKQRNTIWTNSKVTQSYLKRYKEMTERQNYRNKFYNNKWIGKMKIGNYYDQIC